MRNHLASAGAVLVLAFLSLYSQSSLAQACEQKYFSCKVGGKEVTLCGADLGDSFNIMFSIGTETLAEFTRGEKLAVTEHSAGKMTLTSIHFKGNGSTYALTTCEGMECNPDKDTWLSIVKGKKRVKGSGFCDAGSSTGFTNLPFVFDKKGNKTLDKKNFLAEYFAINKNPKEFFLTENISWAE